MFRLPKNVWILSLSLALFMSLAVFIVFVGGIVGTTLATTKSLATLPVAMIVVGTASSIVPVVRLMAMFGRRKVFLGVCLLTIALIGLSIYALIMKSFALFCVSSFGFGVTTATMNQFRFAAIESVDSTQTPTAAAIVLLGGLISAYLGTEVATLGKDWFDVEFSGSFLLLALMFVVAFFLLLMFSPAKKFNAKESYVKRKLIEIVKQGVFIVAVSSAITGYGVMSFIMTATPVSMHVMDGFSLEQTKYVIQSHVVAMFLPSLFTAFIVKYLGISRMMLVGTIILLSAVLVAYIDRSLGNYWIALILLGLGWNFLFIGGTSLLPRTYNENEKYKVQSLNDFLIFGFQAFAALSAGWFVFNFGWKITLLSATPLLGAQFILILWWLRRDSQETQDNNESNG